MTPTKGAWLWSLDCYKILPFVMMQRVTRVCQQQLRYRSEYSVSLLFQHSVRAINTTTQTTSVSTIFLV